MKDYVKYSMMGLLVEDILVNMFMNFHKSESAKSNYDVIDHFSGMKYQVKTVTKGGTHTCPSYMLGASRKYNADKHIDYLIGLDYFIFVDIRNVPIVSLYCLKADTNCLLIQKITPKQFDLIIKQENL